MFGAWLSTRKGMTYTKYSHLATAAKLDIQAEYAKRHAKDVVVAPAVPNTPVA
jgi:hypothetical protein